MPRPSLAEPTDKSFRILFETALDPILILNDDRRCVDANSAACEVLGYTKSELLSLTIDDLVPAEEQAEVPAR